jgi:uncharacterized glyoxalase superfamily protein PhnB
MSYRPEGVTTVTPYLAIQNAAAAIEFYERAFGAEVLLRMDEPDGTVGHATLRIGDSTIYVTDERPGNVSPKTLGATPITFHMYVPDCDATFARAVAAGAMETAPVADQEWGDRYGQVEDPFGYRWGIATLRAQ